MTTYISTPCDGSGMTVHHEGERHDNIQGDIWDVHKWALENLGVCPFPGNECKAWCTRSEPFATRRAIKANPLHGTPMNDLQK